MLRILQALDPRLWAGMLIAIATFLGLAWVYHKGYQGANAEHLAYVQRQDDITAGLLAEQRKRRIEDEKLHRELDARRAGNLRRYDQLWNKWVLDHAGGGTGAQPIRVTSDVCDDPAEDQGLSGAVERYLVGLRSATEKAAAGTARLLADAQTQVGDLLLCQEWAARQRQINGPSASSSPAAPQPTP